MAKQGKHHMGGTRRYVKSASKPQANVGRSPLVVPTQMMTVKGKPRMSTMADQPTRQMLGLRKGGK